MSAEGVKELDSGKLSSRRSSSSEEEEAPSWSKLAIATFLLSIFSPLALTAGFVFWPIAFLTVVFAAAAVMLAARGGRTVRGGWLACAAVVVPLFFLSLAITRYGVQRQSVNLEAQVVAERWFELIKEGKFDEAHQMTMSGEYRQSPEIPLAEYYRLNAQSRSLRDSFFLQPPIKHLIDDPKNCTVKLVKSFGKEVEEDGETVKLRFRMRYLEFGVPHETIFTIGVTRHQNPRFEDYRWMIRGITSVQTK